MLFRMFDIVLDHLVKIGKVFSRHQFGRERVIDRRQNLFLYLTQRNGVIGLFACQFFDREIIREMNDYQARFARLLSEQLLAKFRQKIVSREM